MDDDDDIVLEDDEMDEDRASVIGCDPYLCHYLRSSKIVNKVHRIVKKIKIRAAGEGDVK